MGTARSYAESRREEGEDTGADQYETHRHRSSKVDGQRARPRDRVERPREKDKDYDRLRKDDYDKDGDRRRQRDKERAYDRERVRNSRTSDDRHGRDDQEYRENSEKSRKYRTDREADRDPRPGHGSKRDRGSRERGLEKDRGYRGEDSEGAEADSHRHRDRGRPSRYPNESGDDRPHGNAQEGYPRDSHRPRNPDTETQLSRNFGTYPVDRRDAPIDSHKDWASSRRMDGPPPQRAYRGEDSYRGSTASGRHWSEHESGGQGRGYYRQTEKQHDYNEYYDRAPRDPYPASRGGNGEWGESRCNNDFGFGFGGGGDGMADLTAQVERVYIDWGSTQLVPFERNFYKPHPELLRMSAEMRDKLWKDARISILNGKDKVPNPVILFDLAGFPPPITEALSAKYNTPTPIQQQGWSVALSGFSMVGAAETGSGKTLAYLLPAIVHAMAQPPVQRGQGPIVLIMAPTRELVTQIFEEAKFYCSLPNLPRKTRPARLHGGLGPDASYKQQNELRDGVDILIACSGRLLDCINRRYTDLKRVTYFVLDEADRMLEAEKGNARTIKAIARLIRADRQTLMWSATWPRNVRDLAQEVFTSNDYIHISIGDEETKSVSTITHDFRFVTSEESRWQAFKEYVKCHAARRMVVFCKTKRTADEVMDRVTRELPDHRAECIHGDIPQHQRQRAVDSLKEGVTNILIGTDVLERGLDFPNLWGVIQYHMARSVEIFTHRVGRTGRAGQTGVSLTLLSYEDTHLIPEIEEVLKRSGCAVPDSLKQCMSAGQSGGGWQASRSGPHGGWQGNSGGTYGGWQGAAGGGWQGAAGGGWQGNSGGTYGGWQGAGGGGRQGNNGGTNSGWQGAGGGPNGGWQGASGGTKGGWQGASGGTNSGWQGAGGGPNGGWQGASGGPNGGWQGASGGPNGGWQGASGGTNGGWQGAGGGSNGDGPRPFKPERQTQSWFQPSAQNWQGSNDNWGSSSQAPPSNPSGQAFRDPPPSASTPSQVDSRQPTGSSGAFGAPPPQEDNGWDVDITIPEPTKGVDTWNSSKGWNSTSAPYKSQPHDAPQHDCSGTSSHQVYSGGPSGDEGHIEDVNMNRPPMSRADGADSIPLPHSETLQRTSDLPPNEITAHSEGWDAQPLKKVASSDDWDAQPPATKGESSSHWGSDEQQGHHGIPDVLKHESSMTTTTQMESTDADIRGDVESEEVVCD